MTQATEFLKRSFSQPEIYPLFAILGGALSGVSFIAFHQAKSPDVVWKHKANAEPWLHVKENEQIKLAAFHQKYKGKYNRKEW